MANLICEVYCGRPASGVSTFLFLTLGAAAALPAADLHAPSMSAGFPGRPTVLHWFVKVALRYAFGINRAGIFRQQLTHGRGLGRTYIHRGLTGFHLGWINNNSRTRAAVLTRWIASASIPVER